MQAPTLKALMSLSEAAEQTPYGPRVLKAAITQPTGTTWPPLQAKQGSRGEYLIPAGALLEWIDSLPDA
jgi:pyrroline-5-carboxylate reductase